LIYYIFGFIQLNLQALVVETSKIASLDRYINWKHHLEKKYSSMA